MYVHQSIVIYNFTTWFLIVSLQGSIGDNDVSDSESYSSMPPLESVPDIEGPDNIAPPSTQQQPRACDSLPTYTSAFDTPGSVPLNVNTVATDFVAEQFIYFVMNDRIVGTVYLKPLAHLTPVQLWFRVRVLLEHVGRDTTVPWVDVRFVDHGPLQTPRSRGVCLIIERELHSGLYRELTRALQGDSPESSRYVLYPTNCITADVHFCIQGQPSDGTIRRICP